MQSEIFAWHIYYTNITDMQSEVFAWHIKTYEISNMQSVVSPGTYIIRIIRIFMDMQSEILNGLYGYLRICSQKFSPGIYKIYGTQRKCSQMFLSGTYKDIHGYVVISFCLTHILHICSHKFSPGTYIIQIFTDMQQSEVCKQQFHLAFTFIIQISTDIR